MKSEDIFEQYKRMKLDLSVMEIQIQSYNNISDADVIESMTFGGEPDGERVQTSGTSDKTCGVAMHYQERMKQENDEYIRFLLEKHRKVRAEVEFIETCIRQICGERAGIVFDLLDGSHSWDEIANSRGVSRTTISRIRKDTLRQLNERIRMKDELETEYMFT